MYTRANGGLGLGLGLARSHNHTKVEECIRTQALLAWKVRDGFLHNGQVPIGCKAILFHALPGG